MILKNKTIALTNILHLFLCLKKFHQLIFTSVQYFKQQPVTKETQKFYNIVPLTISRQIQIHKN